ncbi:TPA: hypothetical protein PB378_002762 [Staphylococcus aureus]|uniref:hypothetical protein n=1 Tax=Staphylococcus aureus TaxID=1280 RepID=UPI0015780EBB|nr:hypothetical protein [Staphylococcus aureus]MBB2534446.1 hypothetical protein [Staphylococcus aureus]CAC8081198.1 Uncharacterised protein [Staphylococcus aureus]HDD7598743.1 hypothetical protein [Staphylococcus aureus]HDE0243779.1 hypothetical protein [Staphylococcus aureus]
MRKVIALVFAIVIGIPLILTILMYIKNENEKPQEKLTSNTEHVQKNQENYKDKPKKDSENDKEVNDIVKHQLEANKISKKYIDLAFSNKLSDEYEENKEIFSNNMLKQLERGKYQNNQKKEKKRSNEVKDIQIYINSDETTPKKALFTAIYKNVDKEKKKIIQRRVTGEINFIEEDNKLKIDGSQIIKTAEDDDVKAYE